MDLLSEEERTDNQNFIPADIDTEILSGLHSLNRIEIANLKEALTIYRDTLKLPPNPVWLDSREVQSLLKISANTLWRYRKAGLIKYTMLKGKCRYKYKNVERLAEKGWVGSRRDHKNI